MNDNELQLHGTYRRKDRIYTEDIYYGQGKKLSEATDAEKEADLKVCSSNYNFKKDNFCLWLLTTSWMVAKVKNQLRVKMQKENKINKNGTKLLQLTEEPALWFRGFVKQKLNQ